MAKLLDAALNGQGRYDEKGYFFKGPLYARYAWPAEEVDIGPAPLSNWSFPASFAGGVDAALEGRRAFRGKAYFFKGDQYIRYDWSGDRIDAGYPQPLSAWKLPAPFSSGIDAALNGAESFERYCYFFKGDQYIAYDWETDAVAGEVKKLDDWNLPATFAKGIDTAILGYGAYRGKAYFFKGEQYCRYNWTSNRCEAPTSLVLWNLPWAITIAPRASWGPRAPITGDPKRSYERYTGKLEDILDSIVVHHSGNDDHHTMKAVQDLHMDKKDRADIAYHYGIDLQGNIYEGRDIAVKGAHVAGANTGKIGIVFLADLQTGGPLLDFSSDDTLNGRMEASLLRLIRHLMAKYPKIKYLGGHGEFAAGQGDERQCPGDRTMVKMDGWRTATNLIKP
ncbi:MAG: hemopexin repeat-containing protein [Minicystis sp.]